LYVGRDQPTHHLKVNFYMYVQFLLVKKLCHY